MLRVSELEGNAIKHNLETLKLTEDRYSCVQQHS